MIQGAARFQDTAPKRHPALAHTDDVPDTAHPDDARWDIQTPRVTLQDVEGMTEVKRRLEAEQRVKEVLAQNPQSVRGLELLAQAQLKQRQPDQAFCSSLAAVKLDPASKYAQAQFAALLDQYLPQPAAQTLMFDVAVVSVRNAYRRTKLNPEARAQLRRVRAQSCP